MVARLSQHQINMVRPGRAESGTLLSNIVSVFRPASIGPATNASTVATLTIACIEVRKKNRIIMVPITVTNNQNR